MPGNRVDNSDLLKELSQAVASSVGKPERVGLEAGRLHAKMACPGCCPLLSPQPQLQLLHAPLLSRSG